ncbi:hypothetical protein [uncultured Pontibacter sp.]|uniref:hypothetical protein n=1 Tax=uncultured Pontibacter sp. TaxID=453356 RepID=UPI0026193863|nr:hypothetical protein [uncultured Pontibacter sp.]
MSNINLYDRILLYLRRYYGDGQLYPVAGVFIDVERKTQVAILQELQDAGLVVFEGAIQFKATIVKREMAAIYQQERVILISSL